MLSRFLRFAAFVLSFSFGACALAQTTVTLQQELNSYAGASDDWIICCSQADVNKGALVELDTRNETNDTALLRFSIFQSEGGPVPNGATITSATLSLFKFWGPDVVFQASRLLKSWNEAQVTWNIAATGSAWTSPGALSAGNDYLASPDGQGSIGDAVANGCNTVPNSGPFPAACWLNIDVTPGVQAFSSGTQNFGWKLRQVSSSDTSRYKNFNSKEFVTVAGRPKLTITYTAPPSGNTLSLVSGLALTPASPAANDAATATFTVQNTGGQAVTVQNFGAAVRDPANANKDFQATGPMTLQPNQQFSYSATRSFATSGTYTMWPFYFNGVDWIELAPHSSFTVGPPKISLVTQLALSPVSPAANEVTTATFTIQNTSAQAITLQNLKAAARDPANAIKDFPAVATVTLQPNEQFAYSATRSFATSGNYTAAPFYFDGVNWIQLAPFGSFTVGPAKISLIAPLAFSPASPAANQATTATFTVQNTSSQAVTVQNFGAAVRDPANANVDFQATAPMTLQPGEQFAYSATRSFATNGTYTTWPFYFNGVDWVELAAHSSFTVGITQPVVNNLTLMNADSNAPIAGFDPIPAGATIDLAAMPTRRLNIRANTSPASVGSVSFGYDATANVHVDNGAPYQLSGDPNVDYVNWTPSVGNHNVAATAFTGSGASGTAGPTSSVSFSVTDSGDTACTTGENVPTSTAAGALGNTVPTFHSMSIYYNPPSPPSIGKVWMRYRRACESVWRQGWPLWFDPRTSGGNGTLPYAFRARGSAVYLEPGTKYYFELAIGATYEGADWSQARYVSGSTWPETFPQDGATTVIAARTTALDITVGGSEQTGYKVYDGQNNLIEPPAVKNQGQDYCVRVTVPYVIVRHVVCKGGFKYGIAIAPNVTNVVIEDSDISDWAREKIGTTSWGDNGGNEYGGVHLEGNNRAIVVQRNKIHDPRFGSSPWDVGHPFGPTAVELVNAAGQNVIRYNEIYASGGEQDKKHWLQDGIMGTENDSSVGAPGADSDIYHNIVKHVFDDGIEAEGGGRNVRVWGNYIDHVAIGIATSHVHFGPSYVFRNVINTQRFFHMTSGPDGDAPNWNRGKGFKAYGRIDSLVYGGGRQYFFNNTFLQQPGSTYVGPNGAQPQTYDLGAGTGIAAAGDGQGLRETWSRNNIFHVFRSNASSIVAGSGGTATNDINFDLYNGAIESGDTGQTFEAQGIRAVPVYKSGHGWSAGPRLTVEGGAGVGIGNFQLDSSSNGLNAGTPLPNFTFDIDNVRLARKSGVEAGLGNPDMGAHESGASESMKFGLTAGQ